MLRKILIAIPMMFCIVMGAISFLIPDMIGEILGVSADNAAGGGTVRGDFAALFFTGAIAGALALFKGKTELLWVPIALLGLTLIGRVFEIAVSGFGEGALKPIIIEAVLVAMLFTAHKLSKRIDQ